MRLTRSRRAFALLLAALALAVFARWSEPAVAPRSEPAATRSAGSSTAVAVTVVRVVDGDTVHVRMPDGTREKVRFIGVDTPESTRETEPYGVEASDHTKRQLDGRDVWLETDAERRDRYGRLLAYVWLAPPERRDDAEVRERMFNARLLLDGYAQVMTVPPNVRHAEVFLRCQAEARGRGAGLWGRGR